MHRETDLLFALAALRLELAPREDVLAAVAAWVADEGRVPSAGLALSPARRRAAEALVEAALDDAGGDAARALAASPVDSGLARALIDIGLPHFLRPPVNAGVPQAEVSRYRLGPEIGRGGLGRVVEAVDTRLGRDVAVKLLLAGGRDGQGERFEREARLTARLDHPHVVPVHDFGRMDGEGALYLSMKRIRGRDLGSVIGALAREDEAALRAWSRPKLLGVFQDICLGVAYAHSKGIIHRDLKPSNILLHRLRKGFQPKVMDFGVAKVKDAKHNLTATGTTVGTLHYMSPEQIVGSKSIDGRADIYSLGVTLYKLATGEVPFNAPTEFALMMAQVEAPPLPPSKLRKNLSPELEDVILKSEGRTAPSATRSRRRSPRSCSSSRWRPTRSPRTARRR
jgi:serine/threonine protein kinase